jgi:hypothetical protein
MTSVVYAINDDLTNINAVLAVYDEQLRDYQKDVRINGKTYASANAEQAGMMAYYSEIADDLGIIVDDMEMRLKAKRASTAKKLARLEAKTHTDKQLQMLVDDTDEVMKVWKVLAEVKERHERAKTALNAFVNRGYSLKNLITARAGSFQDETIYVNDK